MADYGMYSREGNKRVDIIVGAAREMGVSWSRVEVYLAELAQAGFAEAQDTVVREAVYTALGFDKVS